MVSFGPPTEADKYLHRVNHLYGGLELEMARREREVGIEEKGVESVLR